MGEAIIVPSDPWMEVARSQSSLLTSAISGFIIAFGFLSPTKAMAIAGIAPYLVISLFRLSHVMMSHREKIIMAHELPDEIAKVTKCHIVHFHPISFPILNARKEKDSTLTGTRKE